jgi:hypothetical protein
MVATSVKQWKCPRHKRRAKKSSLHSPRCISLSLQIQTRWCPQTHLSSLPFWSSAKQLTKRLVFLRRLPGTRSSQKRRRQLSFPLCIAMNQAIGSIVGIGISIIIKVTNAIATTDDLTIVVKTINAMIVPIARIRITRALSLMRRRMIESAIISRKRAARPCTMTSPFC